MTAVILVLRLLSDMGVEGVVDTIRCDKVFRELLLMVMEVLGV